MLKSRCCVLKKQQTVTRFQHGFRVLKKSFCFRVVLIAGEGPKFLKVMLVLQKNYKNFFTGGDIWYLRSLRTAHPSARGGGWRPKAHCGLKKGTCTKNSETRTTCINNTCNNRYTAIQDFAHILIPIPVYIILLHANTSAASSKPAMCAQHYT